MARRTPRRRLLEVGDVLKTHPFDGYWGCALVLTARDKTAQFDPMCHIGVTSTVFTHDYEFNEIRPRDLEIVQFDREARVEPNDYRPLRHESCIGIYSRRITPAVRVIGNIDVSHVAPGPLTFEVGSGSDGGWPLCGRVSVSLGYEAVHAWRAVHDRNQWLADVDAARRSHEELLLRVREAERQKDLKSKKKTQT